MHTCGPAAKARCRRALGRSRSKRSGCGNSGGSRLAPAIETTTRSPARDRRRAERDVAGRVAVDDRRRRLQAQRLLDRRFGARRIGGDGRPQRRIVEHVPQQVEDHPLGGLDPAEHDDRGVGHRLLHAQPARRRPRPRERRSPNSAIAVAPRSVGAAPAAMPDTDATISRYQPMRRSTAARSWPSKPSVSATVAAASGAASAGPQVGAPGSARRSAGPPSRPRTARSGSSPPACGSRRRTGRGGGRARHRRSRACSARRRAPSRSEDRRP